MSRFAFRLLLLSSALSCPAAVASVDESQTVSVPYQPHERIEQSETALPLPAAVADPVSTAPLYKYVGNSFSGKFHRPSCPFAKAMEARHIVLCRFRRDAVALGMAPCRYCLPPFWTAVKAVVLSSTPGDTTGNGHRSSQETDATPNRDPAQSETVTDRKTVPAGSFKLR